MRRLFLIPKFAPLVLSAILLACWPLSVFWLTSFSPDGDFICPDSVTFVQGSVVVIIRRDSPRQFPTHFNQLRYGQWPPYREYLGWFLTSQAVREFAKDGHCAVSLPIPFMLTCLLPFSIGAFNRYRFPLWSWLAYMTLFAAEMAHYFS